MENSLFSNMGTEFAELLLFVMDGSGSMHKKTTHDNREKVEHQKDIVNALIERLNKSPKSPMYRVSLIYFSDQPYVETENDKVYFTLSEVLQKGINNSCEIAGGGTTSIACALGEAMNIIEKFEMDEGIPDKKHSTVFLFTDGRETDENGQETDENKIKVEAAASSLKSYQSCPSIATISFGMEADEELLKNIASGPNSMQKRKLDLARVLAQLPDENKLFIQGHSSGDVTLEKATALRNFVNILSNTQLPEFY